MRNLAVLFTGFFALTCSFNTAMAQNQTGGNSGQQESVTFVLELNDQMIEALKNGEPLKSAIPAHLRNKVTEVRLRYVGGDRTADRSSGIPATTPGQSTDPFRSSSTTGNSGFQSSGQGGTGRTDSNRFGDSLNEINRSGQSGTSGAGGLLPRQTNPPAFSNPARSTFGDQSGTSGNSSLLPPTPRTQGTSSGQGNGLLGPPYRGTTGSTGQPVTNPSGFQPRQPASNPTPSSSTLQPRRPTDTGVQPRSSATGTEFDTATNRNPAPNYGQSSIWDRSQEVPQTIADNGFRPHGQVQPPTTTQPQARLASSAWPTGNSLQDGYQSGQTPYPSLQTPVQPRRSQVAGHDMPMVPNQVPRVAARPEYENGQNFSNQNLAARIPGDQQPDDSYVAVNNGPNGATSPSPVSQLNQFNNFLYFLLLCSIGLNIYLAWISRGFYVRYRELADELRDTFSTAL